MNITSQKFAQLLKNSTLNEQEQLAILDLLASLNEDQVSVLAQILETDNKNQYVAFENASSRRDEVLLKFKLDLKSIEKGMKG